MMTTAIYYVGAITVALSFCRLVFAAVDLIEKH